jgi:hypothetical protein
MMSGVNLVVVASKTVLEAPHTFRSSACEIRQKFVDIHTGMAVSAKAMNSAGLDVRSDFDDGNLFGLALSIYFPATLCAYHHHERVARHHRRIRHRGSFSTLTSRFGGAGHGDGLAMQRLSGCQNEAV